MRRRAGAPGLLVALALGCAAPAPHRFPRPVTPLAPGDLATFEGRYSHSPKNCTGCENTLGLSKMLEGFGTVTSGSSSALPDGASAGMTLTVVDGRHVKAAVLAADGAVWQEKLLEGDIDGEGFFVLGRTNDFEMVLGPIFWVWRRRHVRLGLDERRNLIVDTKISGAIFFLIVPLTGGDGPVDYTFDRL